LWIRADKNPDRRKLIGVFCFPVFNVVITLPMTELNMTDSNVKLTAAAAAILDDLCDCRESVDPFDATSHNLISWTDNPKNQVVKLVFAEGTFDGTMVSTGIRINVRTINLLAEKASLRSWICLMSQMIDLQKIADYTTEKLVK